MFLTQAILASKRSHTPFLGQTQDFLVMTLVLLIGGVFEGISLLRYVTGTLNGHKHVLRVLLVVQEHLFCGQAIEALVGTVENFSEILLEFSRILRNSRNFLELRLLNHQRFLTLLLVISTLAIHLLLPWVLLLIMKDCIKLFVEAVHVVALI